MDFHVIKQAKLDAAHQQNTESKLDANRAKLFGIFLVLWLFGGIGAAISPILRAYPDSSLLIILIAFSPLIWLHWREKLSTRRQWVLGGVGFSLGLIFNAEVTATLLVAIAMFAGPVLLLMYGYNRFLGTALKNPDGVVGQIHKWWVARHRAPDRDTHLRGTDIVDTRFGGLSPVEPGLISFGGVPIPRGQEQQHFSLTGTTGSGKSTALISALGVVRERGERAVVYDPSSEMITQFYRPNKDIILNQFDKRGEAWNPWRDLKEFEYPAFCRSLIPDPTGNADPYWCNAARAVLEALLINHASDQTAGAMRDLVRSMMSIPQSDLQGLVELAGFGGVVGAQESFASVRSSLTTYARVLKALKPVAKVDSFSIKNWAATPDDRWIFLQTNPSIRDAVRPLISMWLDTIVRVLMSLPPDPNRRTWLSLDELPTLQRIPSLSPALAEGRKYGIAGIVGLQSMPQLREIYGKDGAEALFGLPRTRLILRTSDADTCDLMSREIGEKQVQRRQVSRSNTGSSVSHAVVIERAVMASEIASLQDLEGYLRIGGSGVLHIKLNRSQMPAAAVSGTPGFLPID